MAGSGHPHSIHSVGSENAAFVWDNAAAPVLEINSGETVQLECADASGGQLSADPPPRTSPPSTSPGSTQSRVRSMSKKPQPGDVLQIDILELTPKAWGWTAIIPGFGLLADEFPDPWLNISQRRRRQQQRPIRR